MATTRARAVQVAQKSDHDEESFGLARPTGEMLNYLREYARENPEMAAVWCLGIGFILGWRMKPW